LNTELSVAIAVMLFRRKSFV